jgi:hypothetical protein
MAPRERTDGCHMLKRTRVLASAIALSSSLATSPRLVTAHSNAAVSARCSADECSDAWGACQPNVKFVGRDNDCVTFACEVGTPNEHLIKTTDAEGIKTLLKIAQQP